MNPDLNSVYSDIYQINRLNWLISKERTIENEDYELLIMYGVNFLDQILKGIDFIDRSTNGDFAQFNLLSDSFLQSLDRVILTLKIFSNLEEGYQEVKSRIKSKILNLKKLIEEVDKNAKIHPERLCEVKEFFKTILTFQINILNQSNRMLKVL